LTVRDARRMAESLSLPTPTPVAAPSLGEMRLRTKGLGADHDATHAVRDVSMDLREGEIVALMGRNGAGKTTLLRTIAGVHEPATGEVTVDGAAPEAGATVALCPQDPDTLLFSETVRAEVQATL